MAIADLRFHNSFRGRGDSSKPSGDDEHLAYCKRVMAQDRVTVMQQLGFNEFALASHNRELLKANFLEVVIFT